ncbi:MAG: right-handed parallel beta-helix repeat-containing protein [Candidatus Thorarchaeota archaeon]|jgi:nitrous oxidase accessory protein NosD
MIESTFIPSDLTIHNPIIITDPIDFTTLGFTGDGSITTPFLIENLQIDSIGVPCINITNIDGFHFTVKSCKLSGSRGTTMGNASIYFNSGIGKIEQCEFYNSTIGVSANNVSVTISNCSFSEVYKTSIWGANITDSLLSQNSFISNGTYAVLLSDTNHTTIESNTFNSTHEMNVTHQVVLLNCFDIDFVHNYISSHSIDEAVVCDSINELFFYNNTFMLTSGKGAFVTGDDVYIEKCTFTYIGPKTFTYYPRSLMLGRSGYADKISTDFRIINCTFQDLGIVSSRVQGLNVSLCRFIDVEGIQNAHFFLRKSEFSLVSIHNNTFINCSMAIRVESTVSDVTITKNSFIECYEGLNVLANRTSLLHNTFLGGSEEYSAAVRTSPDLGRNITMAFNHIEGFHYGLDIQGRDVFVYNNTITECVIGVKLGTSSSNNHVYYNRFYNNIDHAEDSGLSNIWDDNVSCGNYWDDYQGVGPYTISFGIFDRYPSGPPEPTTTTPSTNTQTEPTTPTDPEQPQDFMMVFAVAAIAIIIIAVLVKKR